MTYPSGDEHHFEWRVTSRNNLILSVEIHPVVVQCRFVKSGASSVEHPLYFSETVLLRSVRTADVVESASALCGPQRTRRYDLWWALLFDHECEPGGHQLFREMRLDCQTHRTLPAPSCGTKPNH
jgi:hypothetical protein